LLLAKIYRTNLSLAPLMLPLLLLPIILEVILNWKFSLFFRENREILMSINLIYIVLVRLVLLDFMLYLFSRSNLALHVTLMRIVGLYLEITLITISFFALMFYLFGLFELFSYNGDISSLLLTQIKQHQLITSFYISTVTFSTLGLGDWIPQTLNAMVAISIEVILGIVQAGVFMAIIIYALQNKEVVAPKKE